MVEAPSGQPGGRRFSNTSAYYDGSSLASILKKLAIPQNRPVLVVVGWAGADDLPAAITDAIRTLMRSAVAPSCSDSSTVIVSGGTDAGVMRILGTVVADVAPSTVLVGVAPHSKLIGFGARSDDELAALPERHHKLIRTEGDTWGDEANSLIRIAEEIAGDKDICVLAVGGGDGTVTELAYAARRRWPTILLMTGHDGTSDRVAAAVGQQVVDVVESPRAGPVTPISLREDLTDKQKDSLGEVAHHPHYIAAELTNPRAVERALRWRLTDDQLLKDAWIRYAAADKKAKISKTPTTVLAIAVLVLAIATVACALGSAVLQRYSATWSLGLKGLATAFPLAAAVTLGLIDRRTRTGTWIEVSASAESVLREIYRFRGRTAPYDNSSTSRECLTEALTIIDAMVPTFVPARSAEAKLVEVTWPPATLWNRIPLDDSLVGPLTPRIYDRARALEQLVYYERAANRLDRRATGLSVTIFVAAALSAFGLTLSWHYTQPWITPVAALLAAVVAALVSWREHRQQDSSADAMLATCLAVRSARARWQARQSDLGSDDLQAFVGDVEAALAAEGDDWRRSLAQAHSSFLNRHRGR